MTFQELVNKGVKVFVQVMPKDKPTDITKYL